MSPLHQQLVGQLMRSLIQELTRQACDSPKEVHVWRQGQRFCICGELDAETNEVDE